MMLSKLSSPDKQAFDKAKYRYEDQANVVHYKLKGQLENFEMKVKGNMNRKRVVSEAEKQILKDDINKLKEELLSLREQSLAKEHDYLNAKNRITELEQQLQKIKIERNRLVNICSELKAELNNLQNRIARQEGGTKELKYKKRILELEEYVKELSKQLAKSAHKEQLYEEELKVEGINVEQGVKPLGIPVKNTERQTLSQQRVAHKIKREQIAKSKPKVRNYNIKDDE